MGLRQVFVIHCDVCQSYYDGEDIFWGSRASVIAEAKKNDWRYIKGKWVCPVCQLKKASKCTLCEGKGEIYDPSHGGMSRRCPRCSATGQEPKP